MFNPHNASFLKQFVVVRRLIESVYALEEVSESAILQILGQLQSLKKQCHPSISKAVSTICDELQERLAWALHISYPLSLEDRDTILDACNELRFELFAAELLSGSQSGDTPRIDDALGAEVFGRGGVSHALVGSTRVILFPRITEEEQWTAVFDELICLYEHKNVHEEWIFDVSVLFEVPGLVLANLIAYAGRLHLDGNVCYLAWLEQNALNPAQLERAKACFALELIDGFYFSRAGSDPLPVFQPRVRESLHI